jgi:DNA polymerase III epsilon subunit-like protein
MKRIFIDTETTGLKPVRHEIIEICIITEFEGTTERFETKIKPQHISSASLEALKINGYNHKEWSTAPGFDEVAQEIHRRITGPDKIIIGHNPLFDMDFLEEHLFKVGLTLGRIRTFDTAALAYEHLYPLGLKSMSLSKIRTFLQWDTEGEHRAGKDCEDTRALFNLLFQIPWWKKLFLWLKLKLK